MSSATTDPTDRLHGLDALRGGALLLGIVLHASLAYTPTPMWIVAEDGSQVASTLFFAIHLFRMTAFFIIAGLFAHMMLERRGWAGFVRNRLARIAGPLGLLWTPVFAAFLIALLWKVAIDNGGSLPTEGPPQPPMTVFNFPLLHLWFLWVLLIFYAVVLVLRAPFAALDRSGGWGRRVDRLTGAATGPWSPLVLGAPLAVAMAWVPGWIPFVGIPTPDTGLVPNAIALTGFGTAFLFGFLLDRRRDLLVRIERLWPVFLVMALGTGTGAWVLGGGAMPQLAPVADPVARAGAAAVYGFAVFASALAAMALCLRFLSGYSAVRRYLADASYWIYIVHMPIVLALQVVMFQIEAAWWIKFAVVIVGTFAISLASYELLVRHTFVGGWLNGRRIPWRKARAGTDALPAE
ncbi:acyltransferase family protein [Brevundimonas vitis]|uniref:Acyltransferase family protein n=1 Tax=Brevundimonas vitisensis TaxID=2800818 RepID=A0ABX7BKP3_9CAUL|nr:acyltransferase family protein [Brevundimonas vitisensis]QQQ18144.1 acyltransferase family protein [Brevundimonas vitisensis]